MRETKIITPYGKKNWSFVKRCFDAHEPMKEALQKALDRLDDVDGNHQDTINVMADIQRAIDVANGYEVDGWDGNASTKEHE